jgi:hypothetical protein
MSWFADWRRKREIDRLKSRCRRAITTMDTIVASMDCGHSLASAISGDYNRAQIRFINAMHRLKELDPNTPDVEEMLRV